MATVFVSHAGEDRALAIELHQWLLEEGHEVFLAHDLHDGIGVGEEWQQRLHERLRWAQVVVCLLTSAYAVSPWCTAELGGAQTRGSRILPVAAEPGVTHPLLRSVQHVDMTRDPAGARLALAEALRRVDLAARRRIRTLLVAAASAIVVFLGGGAGLVTILSASTTDSPDVRARSKNGAGSAEFSWERREILLYDDRVDRLSSILVMKVNGQQQAPVFNSAGMMIRGPSGEKTRRAPKPVPVRAGPNDTVEFRVCVWKNNPELYFPEDTCGDWVRILPR